jgi:hypothetical protein
MKKYPEGFVIKWNDSTLGKPIFGKTIYYEHGKAVEAAKNVSKSSGGYTIVACSEHRDDEIPSGSCHYCAMLQPKISTTESEEKARDFIEKTVSTFVKEFHAKDQKLSDIHLVCIVLTGDRIVAASTTTPDGAIEIIKIADDFLRRSAKDTIQ